MKCYIDFYPEKAVNIFVDEFTTPLASDPNDELWRCLSFGSPAS